LDAYPEQSYRGTVSKIVPTADRAKATVLVKIKFRKYDHRVLPEMGAKIIFLAKDSGDDAGAGKSLLTVPATAVAERSGRQVVYQVKGDRAVEVPVTVGQRIGALIEIKNGLKEGDKIIGKIGETLRAGAKVAVKNP
jgi:multidrug efflux pump subunit AcrA (membrane-fusion protein)